MLNRFFRKKFLLCRATFPLLYCLAGLLVIDGDAFRENKNIINFHFNNRSITDKEFANRRRQFDLYIFAAQIFSF